MYINQLKMTEVSVETCLVISKVLSFSFNFWLACWYQDPLKTKIAETIYANWCKLCKCESPTRKGWLKYIVHRDALSHWLQTVTYLINYLTSAYFSLQYEYWDTYQCKKFNKDCDGKKRVEELETHFLFPFFFFFFVSYQFLFMN